MDNTDTTTPEMNETSSASETPDTNDTAAAVVAGREVKYFFKKEKLKDENGETVGEGRKHPDVKVTLPFPTFEEIVELATANEKVRKLIVEAIDEVIISGGRGQINAYLEANPEGTFKPEMFDLSKLTLAYLSTIDKKARGLWSPSDDDIKAFVEDYKIVMVQTVGYDPKKVGTHCKAFEKGLLKIKADKAILAKIKELLVIYAANTEGLEELQQTYDWFVARIERWLKVEEKMTADAF